MPFSVSSCNKCHEQPDEGSIPVNFDTLGDVDCPKCGAKKSIEIGWETEYFDPEES